MLYGVGDHGGGPTIEMLQRAEELRRVPTFPTMMYDNPDHALAAVRGSMPDSAFPVWHDELYLEKHRGTYTTQARQKWSARHSETLLRTAEALAAVDTAAYPRARFEAVWHRVLFNEFHDILPGSGIHQVYLDANANYDSAWATLDTMTARAFARPPRAPRHARRGRSHRPGRRLQCAHLAPQRRWCGSDCRRGDTATFLARDVPALGARVFPVRAGAALASRLPAPDGGTDLARERVPARRSGHDDRRHHAPVRQAQPAGGARARRAAATCSRSSATFRASGMPGTSATPGKSGTSRRRGVERSSGPGEARLGFTRRWGSSTFHQTLVLGRETPFVDVVNDVDWHETHKLLKVAFTLGVSPDSATYEIPYGTIGRSCRPRTQAERAKYEVAGQRWADLSDSTYGVSLLNDSKYGWDCHGNVLQALAAALAALARLAGRPRTTPLPVRRVPPRRRLARGRHRAPRGGVQHAAGRRRRGAAREARWGAR